MLKNIGLTESKATALASITLEQFLRLPYIEESPACNYINGEAIEKPMGGAKHSLLQKLLVVFISVLGTHYEAFPELRCSYGERLVVADVMVISTNQIPLNENGDTPFSLKE
jgi:Uma2 family endonuclease